MGHILIVDDSKINRVLVREMLRYLPNITFAEAADGKEAIKSILSTATDLILMDIQMPVMDGIECTKYIRSNISVTIPIIAVTAYDYAYIMDGDYGFDRYLSKPYTVEKMREVVTPYLNNLTLFNT